MLRGLLPARPRRLPILFVIYPLPQKPHRRLQAATLPRSLQRHLLSPRVPQLPFTFSRLRPLHGHSPRQKSRPRSHYRRHAFLIERCHLAQSSHNGYRLLPRLRTGLLRQGFHFPKTFSIISYPLTSPFSAFPTFFDRPTSPITSHVLATSQSLSSRLLFLQTATTLPKPLQTSLPIPN